MATKDRTPVEQGERGRVWSRARRASRELAQRGEAARCGCCQAEEDIARRAYEIWLADGATGAVTTSKTGY
jgi:hypothetical protein